MRLLTIKACAAAFVALSGCSGGGDSATSVAAASVLTPANSGSGTTNTGGAGASSPVTGSGTGDATSGTPGDSAETGSASASGTSSVTTSATTTGSTSGGTTGSDPGNVIAALPAAPSALSVTATPANLVVGLNGVLKLAVSATSTANLSYQWRRNGINLSGETSRTLERPLVASDVGARFDVTVSNSGGSTASNSVRPQVILAPDPGQAAPSCHAQQTRPVTGTAVSALADLDTSIQNYLAARQTPAASLIVRNNGVVVLERGYGWQDFTCTRPMSYNGIFRLASLSKAVTRIAVRQAVLEGRLQYTDRIFCLQGSPANCILDMRSISPADTRMANITVQQLIDHTSGWNAPDFPDPAFRDIEIATERSVSAPPPKLEIARFMVNKTPLSNAPGSAFSYLNFGYMLLGMALENRTGQSLTSYAQSAVLNPLGLSNADAMLARSLPAARDAREPWYSDPRALAWVNIFNQDGPVVKFPDGGASYENLDAAGGLAFSARAYSRLMSAYWLTGSPRTTASQTVNYFGSLPGTFTFAYQIGAIDIVLLTNQRQLDAGGPIDEDIKSIVDAALARIQSWPTTPPAGHQP